MPKKTNLQEDREEALWQDAFDERPCIFLKDKKCMIHDAKPYECKIAQLCKGKFLAWEDIDALWKKEGYPLGKHYE